MGTAHTTARWSGWIILAVAVLAVAALLWPLAPAGQAAAANLPTRPPRPTHTPAPTATPTPTPLPQAVPFDPPPPQTEPAEGQAPAGAQIELRVALPAGFSAAAAAQLWTAVQWQDSAGGWHAVEGWQGTPDRVTGGAAAKLWWLPEGLFGRGPFRWAVFDAPGGRRLAASAPFDLPSQPGETALIEVTLTP